MNGTQEHIVVCLYRLVSGEPPTPADQEVVQQWAAASSFNADILKKVQDDQSLKAAIFQRAGENIAPAWNQLLLRISENQPAIRRVHLLKTAWFRYVAAAVMIFIMGTIVYLWKTQKNNTSLAKTSPALMQNDVLPGWDKAILTLSNGQNVMLDSNAKQIITDGKLNIKNENGALVYGKSNVVVYNTMSTPKGGQYKVTLPDGTNVWLNAASSITYPTSFSGNVRTVNITGEAYFEVMKNPGKPFKVKTIKEEIIVLGTHFNVRAYSDEPAMKTSLLEGSVKIGKTILKPGEAFQNGKIMPTNLEQDVAWKNQLFNFQDQHLAEVMRELSRWYNLDVMYEKNIPDIEFFGEMGRNLQLSEVLDVLTRAGVHFRLEANHKLIVFP